MKNQLSSGRLARLVLLLLSLLVVGETRLLAQASTGWTGAATDGFWSDALNWTNGVPNSTTNAQSSAARILNFGPTGNLQPASTNDMNNVSGHRIFFNLGATNYTLYLKSGTGGTIMNDFSQNQPQIQNDSANVQTVDMAFKMQAKGISTAANQAANINPTSGDIVFTTNCVLTLITNTQLRFFSTAGHAVTFYGPLLQSQGCSNGCALMTTASGGVGATVVFYNTNSCSNTIVSCGTVRLATNNVTVAPILLGDTSSTVAPSANLLMDNGFSNNSPLSVLFPQPAAINVKVIGNTAIGSGIADYTGPVSLGTNLTTLANAAGTLEFDGNFDFQNPAGISPRTLTVAGAGNTWITGTLTNATTGVSVLTKTNAGTLVLAGTTNSVRILYDMGGGIISITNGGAIGIPTGANYPDKFNFTASATLSVTNSFTLGRNAGSADNAGFRISGGNTGTFDVAANSTLTLDGQVIDLPGSGSGNLAKTSAGALVLQQSNSYSGNTIISAGRLALSGNGSISNTAAIIVSGGAAFDVSALASGFTLGASQTLSNNTSTATLIGNVNGGSGKISLVFAAGTPALNITNGTLTLSAGTVFKLNNTGAALGAGNYKIIAALAGGVVGGSLPSVAVSGGGTTAAASLRLINGELYLVVGANSPALTSSANPSGYLGSVTFTANVQSNGVTAGDATGNVTFLANGSPFSTNNLAGGSTTSLGLSTLPRGANTITAIYSGDADYLGSTNSLSQVVTNHPPVAGPAVYVRNAAIASYHILISQLLTNVSDADGDSIALVSVGVSTNGVTLVNSGGYLSYYDANPVNDQFTYTATDGFGGTSSGTVTFTIDTSALFGQNSPAISTAGGSPTISFAGIPGYTYSVQRSTNLPVWVTVWTTNAPSNGLFNFTDTFSDLGVTPASAFYRLGWQP